VISVRSSSGARAAGARAASSPWCSVPQRPRQSSRTWAFPPASPLSLPPPAPAWPRVTGVLIVRARQGPPGTAERARTWRRRARWTSPEDHRFPVLTTGPGQVRHDRSLPLRSGGIPMERAPGAGVVHGNRWHFAAEAGSSRAPFFAAGSSLPERRL